jgi:putative nucleotidyltransferase with HDIG domain
MDPRERRARIVDDAKTFVISEDEARPGGARLARVRAAAEALLQAAQAPGMKLPMLPETASEALQLANDPRTPMNRLDRVIGRDGVLAARMLTVAASTAYAGHPVRSVGVALSLLGAGAVRDLLYQSVMECHVFRGKDEVAARNERDHAIAVGHLARAVCKLVGFDPDQAFVCGLLHDIGRLALQSLGAHPALAGLDATDCAAVFDVAHTTLGAHMVTKWKLPALAVEAVRRHHKYSGFGPEADGYSQIGHAVGVADRLAAHLGAGRPARPLDDGDLQAIYALGLDPATLLEAATGAIAQAA